MAELGRLTIGILELFCENKFFLFFKKPFFFFDELLPVVLNLIV